MANPYRLDVSRHSTHGIVLSEIGEHNVVLDVGCNDGYLGRSASPTNSFYGLEISADSVRQASESYAGAQVYDLNVLPPLPWDIQFDVMIFADVLEHVLDPERALVFLSRHLKHGGKAIISLPNVANWQVRLQLLRGRFDATDTGIMDRTHLHFYTYRTARELVRSAGLTVIRERVGASVLGYLTDHVPGLNPLLATGIILIAVR